MVSMSRNQLNYTLTAELPIIPEFHDWWNRNEDNHGL